VQRRHERWRPGGQRQQRARQPVMAVDDVRLEFCHEAAKRPPGGWIGDGRRPGPALAVEPRDALCRGAHADHVDESIGLLCWQTVRAHRGDRDVVTAIAQSVCQRPHMLFDAPEMGPIKVGDHQDAHVTSTWPHRCARHVDAIHSHVPQYPRCTLRNARRRSRREGVEHRFGAACSSWPVWWSVRWSVGGSYPEGGSLRRDV
jgi:hypothetical protein